MSCLSCCVREGPEAEDWTLAHASAVGTSGEASEARSFSQQADALARQLNKKATGQLVVALHRTPEGALGLTVSSTQATKHGLPIVDYPAPPGSDLLPGDVVLAIDGQWLKPGTMLSDIIGCEKRAVHELTIHRPPPGGFLRRITESSLRGSTMWGANRGSLRG